VVSFQGAAGLVPDGIVGPLTQAALDARRGAPGPPGTLTAQQEADAVAFAASTYDQQSVRIIQGQVGIPPTGVFDGATAQAVGRFQAARGLPVNGRVEDPALTPMVAERVAVGMHDQAIHLVADFNGLDMTTDTLSVHLDVALAAPALSDVRFESGNLRLIRLGPGAFASPIVLRDQIRARLQDPAPAFVVAPAPPPLIDPISAQITALLNANRLGDPRSVRAIQGLVGAFPDGAWTPDLVQRVAFFQQQSAIPPNGLVDESRTLPAMSDRLIAIGEQDAVLRIIVDFFDLADDGELLSIYFDPNIGTGRVPFAFVRREDNQPASIQVGPTAFQQPFAGLVHVVAHEMEHIRQLVGGPATSATREFLAHAIGVMSEGIPEEAVEAHDQMTNPRPPFAFANNARRCLTEWNRMAQADQQQHRDRFVQANAKVHDRIRAGTPEATTHAALVAAWDQAFGRLP